MSTRTPQSYVQAVLAAEREQWTGATCPAAPSGCNGPRESECMGLCTHRVNTDLMSCKTVAVAGNPEQRMPIKSAAPQPNRIVAAWGAYKAHRPHSRIDGLRNALRSWRGS